MEGHLGLKRSEQTQDIRLGGRVVVSRTAPELHAERDAAGVGVFLHARAPSPASYHRLHLGGLPRLARFTSTYRYDPYWMRPAAGCTHAEVREETQYLLAERTDGWCVLVVPLFDTLLRFALAGGPEGLWLVGETGDPLTTAREGLAAFVAIGRDPFALVAAGARAVMRRLKSGRLRVDKPLPDFVDQFGWCTWDAFYHNVSPANVRAGLASFAAGGVAPRLLILDDGWLDTRHSAAGGQRLASFRANARFGGRLAPTVRMAKRQFGVRTFLVWHAISGYWSGVDVRRFGAYGARDVVRWHGPGLLQHTPNINYYFNPVAGHVPARRLPAFYDRFHRQLAAAGVDGVKVDNQATLESLATGQGGRVALYQAARTALERSVRRHFAGRLINCMSNANEVHLMCRDSTLLRTSTDFWPSAPASHGAHLYANAQIGVWFGQFIHPDWDMFQSGHPRGAFHAAGRAVSGSPIYVSDKPDSHDFALLRRLVIGDGTILRARRPGVPTRDSLFRDPTREDALLTIVNYNATNAILGVFHCQHHTDPAARHALTGRVSPADAAELPGRRFVVFAHTSGRMRTVRRAESIPVRLDEGGWELYTVAPVRHGCAVLGLADKFNSGGAVLARRDRPGRCVLTLRAGGEFVAWCARAPRHVAVGRRPVRFGFDADSGKLTVPLPESGRLTLRIAW